MRGRVAVCVRRKGLGAEPLLCLAVRTRGERGGEERERERKGGGVSGAVLELQAGGSYLELLGRAVNKTRPAPCASGQAR